MKDSECTNECYNTDSSDNDDVNEGEHTSFQNITNLKVMKKRKSLDKLNERRMKIYGQELVKSELDFLNEVAINRFCRRI